MSRHSIFRKSSATAYQPGQGEESTSQRDESFADEMLSVASRRSPIFRTPKRINTKQPQPITMGPLDPFEFPLREEDDPYSENTDTYRVPQDGEASEMHLSPRHNDDPAVSEDNVPANATFLVPSEAHPNNTTDRDEDISKLRLLAGKLSADWRGRDFMAPALARRIRDFTFAQEKRRRTYGEERPWGILGLYDHLAAIRLDVAWAEDAAWRRANGEPYLSWAEFDSSKKQGINRPFFTFFLLIVCTILLVASIALNGWKIEPLDVNPMIGPSAATLIRMGAKDSDLIVNYGQSWRLFTSIFLHAGLVHFFINMLALWFVGSAIERTHGILSTVVLFVIPAVGGTILSAIFLPDYITVGASGGIFGLIGACLSDITMNWKLLFSDVVNENDKKHSHAMVLIVLVFDILLNCIIGLTPYVDNFTHLGGMIYGFLCGVSTMEILSRDFFGIETTCLAKSKQIMIRFFGLIISVIGIIVTTIILLNGDGQTNPCAECTWMSCISFPPWNDYNNRWWYCDDCGLVKADIITNPSPHLDIACPDGTSVPVEIAAAYDRHQLERELPTYCREYCPNIGAP